MGILALWQIVKHGVSDKLITLIRAFYWHIIAQFVNTFPSCLLVVLFFIMGSTLGFYRATIFYSNWISIISLLNIVSLLITFILYVRRQTSDFFNSIDFYYGTELTPTILDIDIKHFVTYRISFTLWAIYIISAYHYSKSIRGQISLELIACAILQLIYIARTLWFEHFHYSQLDAQVDKAGFCRIWRGMVLLPTLYVTPISLLARNQSVLPKPLSVLLFLMGLTAIYVNTDINQQRYNFRIGNGNVKIWGKDPFFIAAKFRRENGDFGTNLLLGSGWWGLSRHPNYLAEWLSFMFWSLLQGSTTIIPYSPLIYLAIFLYLRTVHDEIRCLGKYGNYWLQHSNRVNFMLIPSIY
ncbi:unnamed protein product [Dracunculus medinensis]|uniref:7-dehydrocholesterol reductase n=1 Tax=Dracunculus medinensis TaxID=318479 RepID=A0A3P7Q016_DRAME|nr:unnamed protein product [Dracunculus medinensis]